MVHVLRLQSSQPEHAVFTHILAARIAEYTKQTNPLREPANEAALALARWWIGDTRLYIAALVDDEAGVVGHVLAEVTPPGVTLHQARADKEVGDALKRAIEGIETWARELKAAWLLATPSNAQSWERKYGYKPLHTVMVKELTR